MTGQSMTGDAGGGRTTEHRYDVAGGLRIVRVRALADGSLEVRVAGAAAAAEAAGAAVRAAAPEAAGAPAERAHRVEVARASGALLALSIDGRRLAAYTAKDRGARLVALDGEVYRLPPPAPLLGRRARGGRAHDEAALSAPMPATVVRVEVAEGDQVSKGQLLVVVEAMKMAHEVRAPRAARVVRVACAKGALVEAGVPLVELSTEGS